MSVISDVIQEEYQRLKDLVELYDKKISDFPKGVITKRKRGQHIYYYLSFRDHDKVKSIYIGKEGAEKVQDMAEKIKQRRQYEQRKKKALENIKEVKGYLRAEK